MKIRLSSMQVLSIGFALIIIIGGILLWLPISNRDGIPFINAIFTSASAACVTGLVVYDTFTQFTLFGQAVILMLIQVGGLGFMMVGILFSMFMGRRIGLRQRSLLMDSVGFWKVGGIVRLTRRVLIATGIAEFVGALILAFRFCPRFGLWEGIWTAIFHSVSAFCNAGFDIMGRIAPNSSLMAFADDIVVNLTIVALIIIGGLGFFLWNDVFENKWHVSKYQLHTKIVLSMTAVLITLGTLGFFFLEKETAFYGLPFGERALASLFQSVTPRTAGFNTVDLTTLSEGGTLLTMVLMLIGAGSGSTAGGIKVTTLAVLLLSVISQSKRHDDLNIFGRRLEDDAVKRACSSTALYIMLSVTGCFILCVQGFSITESMFEALSAIGTVGLTVGITPRLPILSKIVIILLMYIGRVGSLSVVMAMSRGREDLRLKKTTEKIIIG